jgi:hypothetical protein
MTRKSLALMTALALTVALCVRLVAADPFSGTWSGTFDAMGQMVPFTMTLAVDAGKVTGTVDSEHTGVGHSKDGVVKDGAFSMTMEFEKHQAIAFTGKATKDGLAGEFTTEGFTGKWTAARAK